MGKAIRNFKDSLSGVEEAKFHHLEEKAEKPLNQTGTQTAQAEPVEAQAADQPGTKDTKKES